MSWKGTSIWAHMPIGNTHPQILSRNFYVMFCKEKYRFIFQFCIFCIHMLWPRDKCCSHLPSCPKYRCTDTTIKKTPSPQKPLHFSVLKGRENMRVPVSGSFSHRFELELFCFQPYLSPLVSCRLNMLVHCLRDLAVPKKRGPFSRM